MTTAKQLQKLVRASKALKPQGMDRFFKTGKGEYSEHDRFLGLRMPDLRQFAKDHRDMELREMPQLLSSEYNDERCLALVIMCEKFKSSSSPEDRKAVVDLYLSSTKHINNWNLVDVSSYPILGEYLLPQSDRSVLYSLARSENMWERRIAIVSTMAFLRKRQYSDTFAIAELLLDDQEDLMHKAVGWLVKEVGKRDQQQLIDFLDRTATRMPRTMLRFAVEKLPPSVRAKYLDLHSSAQS